MIKIRPACVKMPFLLNQAPSYPVGQKKIRSRSACGALPGGSGTSPRLPNYFAVPVHPVVVAGKRKRSSNREKTAKNEVDMNQAGPTGGRAGSHHPNHQLSKAMLKNRPTKSSIQVRWHHFLQTLGYIDSIHVRIDQLRSRPQTGADSFCLF